MACHILLAGHNDMAVTIQLMSGMGIITRVQAKGRHFVNYHKFKLSQASVATY